MDYKEKSVAAREKHGGMIGTEIKERIVDIEGLSTYYTPGIAEPCRRIHADKSLSKKLTIRKNLVAVISDGSAVLGLGNIGPEAALPVMEGKCMLLKSFANVDAMPIVLDTQDTDEIVQTIKNIAPTLGGINLEDIAAPRCFEIEAQLTELLDIPVFHDDQHGTAMVVLAAVINALKVVEKKKEDIKVVFTGAGAAGIAIAKLLRTYGVKNITLIDSKGVVDCTREDINDAKRDFCVINKGITLEDAIVGADMFIGVSAPNLLSKDMVASMADKAIVFAMANPDPEILPSDAIAAGAAVVGTGRSDFPNQINNVLVFPGFFRGMLDAGATKITSDMKLAASIALASLVENPTAEMIVPSIFDERVTRTVSEAIKAAIKE